MINNSLNYTETGQEMNTEKKQKKNEDKDEKATLKNGPSQGCCVVFWCQKYRNTINIM